MITKNHVKIQVEDMQLRFLSSAWLAGNKGSGRVIRETVTFPITSIFIFKVLSYILLCSIFL